MTKKIKCGKARSCQHRILSATSTPLSVLLYWPGRYAWTSLPLSHSEMGDSTGSHQKWPPWNESDPSLSARGRSWAKWPNAWEKEGGGGDYFGLEACMCVCVWVVGALRQGLVFLGLYPDHLTQCTLWHYFKITSEIFVRSYFISLLEFILDPWHLLWVILSILL